VIVAFDKAAQNTGGPLPKSGWYGQTRFDKIANGIEERCSQINVLSCLERGECSFVRTLQAYL
jgi:hypothetical protein